MKKLRNFFRVFKNSLTNFEYYKEIIKAPFSFSLKYLFFLLFLTSLVTSLFLAFGIAGFIPQIPAFTDKLKSAASNIYPQELVISIKDQKLTTNVKEPYIIEIPQEFNSGSNKHLITIDTKGSTDDYKKYNSIFLVTSDAIVAPDSQSSTKNFGTYKVYPLTDSLNKEKDGVILNRKIYDEILAKLLPYLSYFQLVAIVLIIALIFLLPFLLAVFGLSIKLAYLLVFTLVLWVIAKVMKKSLDYKKLYQLSMHGSTLVILLDFILGVFGLGMPFLLPSLILLVFMILVLSKFN